MKLTGTKIRTLLGVAAASVCLFSATGQQASAGQLYNGWNYGIDASNDGSGGSSFEIKGMAIKEVGDSIFVALTGGMPLTGAADGGAADGNIGWGDLFFNLSGKDFQTASSTNSLFGIRFAGTNDSNAATTGVYKNVSAMSVTGVNNGYGSLNQYYNSGFDKANTQGTDLATKEAAYNYFGQNTPILNEIGSGTKVGDITMLTATQLLTAGLNFGHFGAAGSQTIGFQLSRSLLGSGSYMANVFVECGNDGVALAGNLAKAPEPSSIVGLALVGLTAAGSMLRKRRLASVNIVES
ncbi:PEP-CTERM sorting domain-containing protein [Phormidium sp. LEGE 05292]|uniref:XDD3 family exosortase-dependent surface protein n=1 Tax=[Phormidium] sp. LEGE 05292 TaxID=767427 RepID=UPI00188083C8|nr:XDD3 family exosortase-dependent surface protein [Phormidium sp. LEGE 05292]MBE9225528.1 PEP-CTERM sorting domain-containing protein [Phormidium sp. LEGE 05292]